MLKISKNNLFVYIFLLGFASIAFGQNVLDGIAAIVDDDIILQSEVTQGAFQLAMQYGIDLNKTPDELPRLRKMTLDNLVNVKVLLIQADKDTVEANDKQVDAALEQQMQYVSQQLGGDDKIEEYFGLSLAKIRRTYREQIAENMRVSAVRDQKMAKIIVTRREVSQFFNTKKDSIGSIKEAVDISHILIQTQPGTDADKAAYDKIKEIRERALKGENFADLAKEYSEDPGSAVRGGNLGFMSRGEFVREYEEAAFNLQPGQISDIVKSQYGYHVIRLEERRGEKINTSHILITKKPTHADEVAAADKIKKVYGLLKSGKSFEDMVKEYSMDASTKEDNGHLGRFEIDQLKDTAKEFTFALNGLKPGDISEPVKTKFGFHILKLNSREEPRS
jgi:peptidyl-prolyl cis-trans isomerase SurA